MSCPLTFAPTEHYVPALGYRSLTRLYDPIVHLVTREATFKRTLVEQAALNADHHVLDLGCGTGTLTLMIKRACPKAEVVGLDGDERVLTLAKTKVAAAGLSIRLDHVLATALPYPSGSFDRVLSSLLFHHLTHDGKLVALREVLRVLQPGGELHIADWGKPHNAIIRLTFLAVQLLDGFETTADNLQGRLPAMIQDVGFERVFERRRLATLFGAITLYSATKPT